MILCGERKDIASGLENYTKQGAQRIKVLRGEGADDLFINRGEDVEVEGDKFSKECEFGDNKILVE